MVWPWRSACGESSSQPAVRFQNGVRPYVSKVVSRAVGEAKLCFDHQHIPIELHLERLYSNTALVVANDLTEDLVSIA